MIPETGDTTTCSIFMASITSKGWPARTDVPLPTLNETTVPCSGDGRTIVPPGASLGEVVAPPRVIEMDELGSKTERGSALPRGRAVAAAAADCPSGVKRD